MGHLKLRILQVITRLVRGGAPNVVLSIAEGMAKKGHSCELATGVETGREGELLSRAKELGLKVIHIPSLVREVRPARDLAALFELMRVIATGRYDVVHTHTSKAGLLGRVAAKLAGVRAIVHSPHGHIFAPLANIPGVSGRPVMKKIFYWVERVAARFCDHIVCLSENEKRELLGMHLAMPGRVSVIRNAVDVAALREAAGRNCERKLRLPASSFVIGVAGRLTAEKGVSVLLTAMKEVLVRVPGARLVIAGDGPERAALEQQARDLGIADAVDFLGMRTDLPRVLATLDVFVLPSLYEGFGLVLLEAMAVGTPVIATRVGGVPEVVEDGVTGLLVPPADPGKLAKAILRLERDAELAETLVKGASLRLQSNFDLPRLVDTFEQLYFSLSS